MARPKGSTNRATRSSTGGAAGSKSSNSNKRQTPLSFQNKITKPSPSPLFGKTKDNAEAAKLEEELSAQEEVADVSVSGPESADVSLTEPEVEAEVKGEGEERKLAFREREKDAESRGAVDEAEQQARKISDAQVKRYWQGVDGVRIAPRVHQQGLSLYDKILRHFDMSSQFGPSIGIPRTIRWKRASKLGLNPPIEVLAVLFKEEEGGRKGQGQGKGLRSGKSKEDVERSHIDEMVSARLGIVAQ